MAKRSNAAVLDAPPETEKAAAEPRQTRVGDVVHFVSTGTTLDTIAGQHRAAIVIGQNAGGEMLLVHAPAHTYRTPANYDPAGKRGTWHFIDEETPAFQPLKPEASTPAVMRRMPI